MTWARALDDAELALRLLSAADAGHPLSRVPSPDPPPPEAAPRPPAPWRARPRRGRARPSPPPADADSWARAHHAGGADTRAARALRRARREVDAAHDDVEAHVLAEAAALLRATGRSSACRWRHRDERDERAAARRAAAARRDRDVRGDRGDRGSLHRAARRRARPHPARRARAAARERARSAGHRERARGAAARGGGGGGSALEAATPRTQLLARLEADNVILARAVESFMDDDRRASVRHRHGRRSRAVVCFHCGLPGHWSRDCPDAAARAGRAAAPPATDAVHEAPTPPPPLLGVNVIGVNKPAEAMGAMASAVAAAAYARIGAIAATAAEDADAVRTE